MSWNWSSLESSKIGAPWRLARTQACNAQHGALAWRQTQSCWWNGTKYSYCMLIHATRTLSINIPSFVLHYIVITQTCQNHHRLNHNNLYPSFTRLIDQILYPLLASHHISSIHHPSYFVWFSGFAKAEQLRHPKRQQRGGSERQRIVRPWCFQFQNETPWLRNASRKNVCCSFLTGSGSSQAERHKAAAKESMHNKTVRTLELFASYDITEHHRNLLLTSFDNSSDNQIQRKVHNHAKFPSNCNFPCLPQLYSSWAFPCCFQAFLPLDGLMSGCQTNEGSRISVRGLDLGESSSLRPWTALWIRKCKGALVFVGNHPHIIRPGRCRF